MEGTTWNGGLELHGDSLHVGNIADAVIANKLGIHASYLLR